MAGDLGDQPIDSASNLDEVTIMGIMPDGKVVQIPMSYFLTVADGGNAGEEEIWDGGSATFVPDPGDSVDGGSA